MLCWRQSVQVILLLITHYLFLAPRKLGSDNAWFFAAFSARRVVMYFVFRATLSMLLMIDNYDSFTYNLVQYFGELGEEVTVFRNDEIRLDEIGQLKPERIVISPGPCTPSKAGISVPLIEHFHGQVPILGVCLGHQSIGQAFGGKIAHARQVMHGKTSPVFHNSSGLFRDLPNPFHATRYHSLVIERESLPDCLEITAWTEDGEIMGVRHKTLEIEGVQFHPESILTEHGHKLLANFLNYGRPGALHRT
jgi:anthranilate synthase component 2